MMKFSGHVAILALLVSVSGCDAASTAKSGTTAAKGEKLTSVANRANWLDVATATPEGGFRLGNPDAKVKLLEFASMTCPHCKDFHESAFEALKAKYIATGKVSYEYRNFVLNGPDYAASMLARCQGAQPFFGLLNAFYTDQASWTEPFTKMTPADSARIGAMPQDKQIAGLAEAGKLDAYARLRGIPKAKFEACLTDKAALDKLLELRTQATDTYKLTGTPGFIINGKTQENVYTWDALEPKLIAALQ